MDKRDNLIPQAHVLTVEEQSIGGKKSGESRRSRANLRKALETLLEEEWIDEATGKVLSGAELISLRLFEKAMRGDIRAFEMVRDTCGQKQIDRFLVQQQVSDDVIAEVEEMVLNYELKEGGELC